MAPKAGKGGIFAKLKNQIKSSVDKMSKKTFEALTMVQNFESKPVRSEPMRKLLEGSDIGDLLPQASKCAENQQSIAPESPQEEEAPKDAPCALTDSMVTPPKPKILAPADTKEPAKVPRSPVYVTLQRSSLSDLEKPSNRRKSGAKRTSSSHSKLAETAKAPSINSSAAVLSENQAVSDKLILPSVLPVKRTTTSLDNEGSLIPTHNKVRLSSERIAKSLRESIKNDYDEILPAILREPPLAYRLSQTAPEALNLDTPIVQTSKNANASITTQNSERSTSRIAKPADFEHQLISNPQQSLRPVAHSTAETARPIANSHKATSLKTNSAAHRFRNYTQQPLNRLVQPVIKPTVYNAVPKSETSRTAAVNAFKATATGKPPSQRSSANFLHHIRPVNLSRSKSGVDVSQSHLTQQLSTGGMAHSAAVKAAKTSSQRANTSLQSNASFTSYHKPASTSSLKGGSIPLASTFSKAPLMTHQNTATTNLSEQQSINLPRKISSSHHYKGSSQSFSHYASSNLNRAENFTASSSNYSNNTLNHVQPLENSQKSNKRVTAAGNYSHHKTLNPAIASTPVRHHDTREAGDGSVTQQDFGNFSNFSNFSFVASWAQTPELKKNTIAQRNIDGKQIFGEVPPVDLESLFHTEQER